MNWRRRKTNSPPGTGGVAEGRGGSKVEMVLLDSNDRIGKRVIRSIYHPVAARHPSCSRRGVGLPSSPIHSHLGTHLLFLQLQRDRIDAVPHSRRFGPVVEHVSKMRSAGTAHGFGARHSVTSIFIGSDTFRIDGLIEAGPSGAGIEFRTGIE